MSITIYFKFLPIQIGSSCIDGCVGIGRVPGVDQSRIGISERSCVVETISRRFPGRRHFRFLEFISGLSYPDVKPNCKARSQGLVYIRE